MSGASALLALQHSCNNHSLAFLFDLTLSLFFNMYIRSSCFFYAVFIALACSSVALATPFMVRRTPVSDSTVPRSTNYLSATIIARDYTNHVIRSIISRSRIGSHLKNKRDSSDDKLFSQLLPVSGSGPTWTTVDGASGALPLNDDTLQPHSVDKEIPYSYVQAFGKTALKAHYPKGSYKPSGDPPGGVSFYGSGPKSVDLTTAKEALFGYSVMFPKRFQFVKGGKLPGFCTCLYLLLSIIST